MPMNECVEVAHKSIENIEDELRLLIANDKNAWIKIYKLMQEVDDNELYKETYRSFTAWVNSFAQKNNVNVSLLWSRLKAGRYYSKYEQHQKSIGKDVTPIDKVDCSADCFVFIEKIAKDNIEVSAPLIDKAISHELTRVDFQKAYEEKKKSKLKKSTLKYDGDGDNILITANDIVESFSNYYNWLEYTVKPYQQQSKYHVFKEFAVQTGTSRHARRMDLLVMETISTPNRGDIYTHGIEIKVSKSDLLNDHKMQEYREHCEFFWIAVPNALIEYAEDICCDDWGIIAVSNDKKITVVKQAKYRSATFKNETMQNALLKLL
jgi:hypothetical protein